MAYTASMTTKTPPTRGYKITNGRYYRLGDRRGPTAAAGKPV